MYTVVPYCRVEIDFIFLVKFSVNCVVSVMKKKNILAKNVLSPAIKTNFVPSMLPNKNLYISRPKRMLALFNIYLKFEYYDVTT